MKWNCFELIVDFLNARMWRDNFHIEMRLALRVRTNQVLNDSRAFDVHDVATAILATIFHL